MVKAPDISAVHTDYHIARLHHAAAVGATSPDEMIDDNVVAALLQGSGRGSEEKVEEKVEEKGLTAKSSFFQGERSWRQGKAGEHFARLLLLQPLSTRELAHNNSE